MSKRCIDIVLAGIGCVILLPVFPVVALLIKLSSKGPVLYLCDRIGKDSKPFKMYKFRTLHDMPDQSGPSVCPQGDPRVTPVGRFLRRTKLNEFPQLLNVLRGEMSFVGPRPEAPDLAAQYPPHARAVFSVKPGLVGPNQILGRNEDESYPSGVDPQQYYFEELLPKKLPVDLAYVQQSSALTDLKYILLGLKETIFKVLNWNMVLQNQSQIYLLLADLSLSLVSFTLAYSLGFARALQNADVALLLRLLLVVVVVRVPSFIGFGLYGTLIRYLSFHDLIGVFKGVSAGSVFLVSAVFLLRAVHLPPMIFVVDWLCLMLLMTALRYGLRLSWERNPKHHSTARKRALIFGAGDAGALAYQALMAEKGKPYEVIGFLDDDPMKRHKALYGKKVLGNRFTLEAVVNLYRVREILLAIPSSPPEEFAQVVNACQKAGIRYRVFPTLRDTPSIRVSTHLTPLAELLDTPKIRMDEEAVRQILTGKRVLVTGACGALGVELCRQILRFAPQKLVIIDRYESYLTELVSGILNTFPADRIVPVLCPPGSNGKSGEVFLEHQPHIVFHTTMRKYPPLFDIQVEPIVHTNYLYTFALARQAANCGSEAFVMLSSLEAARRGNPISDSLRAAEISLRQFFATHDTSLVIVRLCDILENRGGTVAAIADQIAHREPIVLPSPDAKQRLLAKRDAAHFILASLALSTGPSGEGIFVCDSGTPMSLLEIARELARRNGLQLNTDLSVRFLVSPQSNGGLRVQKAANGDLPHLTTACVGIRQLQEKSLAHTPEMSDAIEHLLNLKEQDLERAAWEQPTHRLLAQESG